MKWFKHMSDLSRDEGVCRYLDAAGNDRLVAYGFLMLVLEAIASRMGWGEGDIICSATYSTRQWGRITYSQTNRVRKYLDMCEVIGWVLVEYEGRMCKVSITKMVQWRDEYTRKSGHTPDKVAQSREDQTRPDKRESNQDGSLPDGLMAEGAGRSPPPDFEVSKVMQEWAATNYPSVDIDKETAKFVNYEFTTPCSDWNLRWKLWIQRAAEHQDNLNGTSDRSSDLNELSRLAELFGVERRADECETDFLSRVNRLNEQRISNLGNDKPSL